MKPVLERVEEEAEDHQEEEVGDVGVDEEASTNPLLSAINANRWGISNTSVHSGTKE